MVDSDIKGIRSAFRRSDLAMALGLLTRLPLPYPAYDATSMRPAAHAAWAYPLVGAIIAVIASAAAWVAQIVGLPPMAQAVIVLLVLITSTGAMHEDGLADCADGFWGGWTRERRLEIMKDSQIGSYGVVALVLSLLLRWSVITLMIQHDALLAALIGAAVVSRGAMVAVMYNLPLARATGLSGKTGRPSGAAVGMAAALAFVGAMIVPDAPFFGVCITTVLIVLGMARLAKSKIGGQTGDVLGATQQMTEIGVWLCLAAAFTV